MLASRTSLASLFFLAILWSADGQAATEGIEGRVLTLDACIGLGLRQNPAVEIATQGLRVVQERVGEAKAGYYPTFKLSSSYTFTDQQDRMPLGPDVYDTRLGIKGTLYDAGATFNLVKSAQESSKAQSYDVTRTALDIELGVRTAFYEVLKKRELVEVAQRTLQVTQKHLDESQALYREGVAPRSDVIKSEVQVSNAMLDVIKAENSLLSSKASLATAMGQPVTTTFDVATWGVSGELPAMPLLTDVMAQAYQNRPELKGVRAKIDSAIANVEQARSGFYPNVGLDITYGWQDSKYFSPTLTRWNVGVTVSLPLFEQLTTKARVGEASAAEAGLRATELQIKRAIELELEQAWLSLKEAGERLTVVAKTIEQSGEDMRVSEGRYREGVGNILELIEAQTAVTQAQTNRVVAWYDVALAGARLERAVGKQAGGTN